MILGQDCYDIHHPFEFRRQSCTKTGWALNGLLPAKQAATLATTATSIADDKLANQLSGGISSPTLQTAMSPDIQKKSNDQSRRSKQRDSKVKVTKYDFCGERTKLVAKQLLCNGATQVSRTAPAERRNAKEALYRNH